MHLDHLVPVGFGGVGEGLVAQDAGVADQDVGLAECSSAAIRILAALHGGDVVAVGHGLAAGGLDGVDHLLRRRWVAAGAVAGPAEVVDDDGGAFLREQLRIGLAQPVARAGDDRNLAVEQSHGGFSLFVVPFMPGLGRGERANPAQGYSPRVLDAGIALTPPPPGMSGARRRRRRVATQNRLAVLITVTPRDFTLASNRSRCRPSRGPWSWSRRDRPVRRNARRADGGEAS